MQDAADGSVPGRYSHSTAVTLFLATVTEQDQKQTCLPCPPSCRLHRLWSGSFRHATSQLRYEAPPLPCRLLFAPAYSSGWRLWPLSVGCDPVQCGRHGFRHRPSINPMGMTVHVGMWCHASLYRSCTAGCAGSVNICQRLSCPAAFPSIVMLPMML